MNQILRTWLGFAAIGAGLVHMALAAGSPLVEGIILAGLGVAEFGWGVLTFARDRLVVPRIARGVALAPIMIWALLVVLATLFSAPQLSASLTFLPMAVATVFEIFVAAVLSRHLRPVTEVVPTETPALVAAGSVGDSAPPAIAPSPAASRTDVAPATPPAGRYLLALGAGALAVGLLVTPALAATEAGRYAQAHGMHMGGVDPAPKTDPLSGLNLDEHNAH